MTPIRKIAKAVIPRSLRRFLRARHRGFVFGRAMRRFRKDPEAATRDDSRVIPDLIYGWGNERWSALDEYLKACVRSALTCTGPLLECGSGLTTILIGTVAQQTNNTMWSLEHASDWGERAARYLKKYRIKAVQLWVHPLKNYGAFAWYDPPVESLPNNFAMVICDGPPGTTRGGRSGLAAVMKDRIAPGTLILLDDAAREQEQTMAMRWSKELGADYEVMGTRKPFIRMVLQTKATAAALPKVRRAGRAQSAAPPGPNDTRTAPPQKAPSDTAVPVSILR